MGTLRTPDGTCSSDNTYHEGGVTCWYSVIPATPPDQADYDNSHGGSGFMLGTLDYYANSDNRLAAWAWTGLHNLASTNCSACSGIQFSGTLFSECQSLLRPARDAIRRAGSAEGRADPARR